MRHCAAFLLLALAAARPAGAQTVPVAKIDEFVRAEMARQKIPGVAIAVVKNGAVVKIDGYGFANVEHKVPVTPATIFQSGSLGKQFTAAAVMLQVEDGKLALTDRVTKFFPDAPQTWRAITVRHLLTHTSGIPDYTDGTHRLPQGLHRGRAREVRVWTEARVPGRFALELQQHRLCAARRDRAQGVGQLLRRCPRGARLQADRHDDGARHRRSGYRPEPGRRLPPREGRVEKPGMGGAADEHDGGRLALLLGCAISSPGIPRCGPRAILKPESWDRILKPVRLTSGKTYPYGFGWSIDERGEQPMHSHGGSWQGFKTQFSRFVGDELSIIVLANLAQADPERFADGIAAIVNERLAVPTLRPTEDKETGVTARLEALLQRAREGTLAPSEFAYIRAGFFPDGAKAYQERLRELGPAGKLVLVRRNDLGDDRVYTYEIAFGARTMYYTVALAPDDKIAQFSLREKN